MVHAPRARNKTSHKFKLSNMLDFTVCTRCMPSRHPRRLDKPLILLHFRESPLSLYGLCGQNSEITHMVTLSHFASLYTGYMHTLLAFGSESNQNSNCSSLAWSTSCPSSSYLRHQDKHNVVARKTHAASASEMHIKISRYTTR